MKSFSLLDTESFKRSLWSVVTLCGVIWLEVGLGLKTLQFLDKCWLALETSHRLIRLHPHPTSSCLISSASSQIPILSRLRIFMCSKKWSRVRFRFTDRISDEFSSLFVFVLYFILFRVYKGFKTYNIMDSEWISILFFLTPTEILWLVLVLHDWYACIWRRISPFCGW